ncbi:unnamed protein product, partial [marine sediment metagenome]
ELVPIIKSKQDYKKSEIQKLTSFVEGSPGQNIAGSQEIA